MRLAALTILPLVLPACGDDSCGPVTDALSVTAELSSGGSIAFEGFHSSPNNDCGEPGGPTSLTIEATQQGSSRPLVLCVPRPDKVSGKSFDISDDSRILLIDLFADSESGCLLALDRTRDASGQIGFEGVCDSGLAPEGYQMSFELQVPLTETCDPDPAIELTATLQGEVVVSVDAAP
jgi:hypothetical protein